jgi:hypothetical protein
MLRGYCVSSACLHTLSFFLSLSRPLPSSDFHITHYGIFLCGFLRGRDVDTTAALRRRRRQRTAAAPGPAAARSTRGGSGEVPRAHPRVVAVQVTLASKMCNQVSSHFIGSRVETRRFQAMGPLDSQLVHRAPPRCTGWRGCARASCRTGSDTRTPPPTPRVALTPGGCQIGYRIIPAVNTGCQVNRCFDYK